VALSNFTLSVDLRGDKCVFVREPPGERITFVFEARCKDVEAFGVAAVRVSKELCRERPSFLPSEVLEVTLALPTEARGDCKVFSVDGFANRIPATLEVLGDVFGDFLSCFDEVRFGCTTVHFGVELTLNELPESLEAELLISGKRDDDCIGRFFGALRE